MNKTEAELKKATEVMTRVGATFNDFLELQLSVFDEVYSESQVLLYERPFRAAVEIVQYCILEISNDSKEDFVEKAWFKKLYSDVDKWYRHKYGKAMDRKGTHNNGGIGVVSIYQTPFEVAFPWTIANKKKDAPPESVWIDWPNGVLPDESVTEYVISPPNFESMEIDVKRQIIASIKFVIARMRSIRINCMTAHFDSDNGMTRTIAPHLEKAAKDILGVSDSSVCTAFWEVQMAVEKVVKIFIYQQGSQPPQIHDLKKLSEVALENGGLSVNTELLKCMPPPKVVTALRYSPQRGFGIKEAITAYNAGLDLVSSISAQLKREITMNDVSILIKRPPWLAD